MYAIILDLHDAVTRSWKSEGMGCSVNPMEIFLPYKYVSATYNIVMAQNLSKFPKICETFLKFDIQSGISFLYAPPPDLCITNICVTFKLCGCLFLISWKIGK